MVWVVGRIVCRAARFRVTHKREKTGMPCKPVFTAREGRVLGWQEHLGEYHLSPVVSTFFDGDRELVVVREGSESYRVIDFNTGETRS